MESRWESRFRARAVTLAMAGALLGACAAEPGMAPEEAGTTGIVTTTTTTAAPAPVTAFLPDVTARPITLADVEAMLPTGSGGMAESASAVTEPMSNADLLTRSTLDPDDEASDLVRFGRLLGAAGTYPQTDATAYVWIDVLSDADAAHGYLLDFAGDAFKGRGGTHAPEIGAVRVAEFPIAVGEEAIGLDLSGEGTAHETAVVFRLGRIVVWASYARADEADTRVALQYLADELGDRVISTLITGVPDPPRPDAPDHRFETTISVDAGGRRYRVEATGSVSGNDLSCSLHLLTPAGEKRLELISVDLVLWARPNAADESHLVGGNLAERSLLTLCPPWPLDARDAGLTTAVVEAPASHPVDGLDAFGYRSDLPGLEAALGAVLDGATVDAFSYWLADGVPWLLELTVIARGDAASLEPLTGPGFETLGDVTVTIRHRVTDLGKRIDPIVPPG